MRYIAGRILKIKKHYLKALFNKAVLRGNFPNELKLADVVPVFTKENPLTSKDYRPVSFLTVVSKIFERIMHKIMRLHVDNIF